MGEARSRRGRMLVLLPIAMLAVLAMVASSGAEAKKHHRHHHRAKSAKPVVKVNVLKGSQASIASSRTVKVWVTAKRPRRPRRQRAKLTLKVVNGNLVVKHAGHAHLKLKRGRTVRDRINLNPAGARAVARCGSPRLVVVAHSPYKPRRHRARRNRRGGHKGKGKKAHASGHARSAAKRRKAHRRRHGKRWVRSGRAKRTIAADRSRCGPSPKPAPGPKPVLYPVPSTIDLSSADRCDFITEGTAPRTECLFPYPNDYFTRPDPSTDTGLRLNIDIESTPANSSGKHIDPTDLNTSDGFSPGAPIVTQVPGMDNIQAFQRTGIVPITQKSAYEDPDQPVVLIDAATGQRQGIWAELDANASSPAQTDLEIHTDRNLLEGHRYIVAMRDMRRADGSIIPAPDGFKLYRDHLVTGNKTIESRRAHFESIFKTLAAAGIPRGNLYMAWDFTVASERNITERMLHIRNDAFRQLGDDDLGDGVVKGHAPAFDVTDVENYPLSPVPTSGDGVENIRTVSGTFQVPCYLDTAGVPDPDPNNPDGYPNGCPSGSKFKLGADGLPIRTPGKMMTARFTCDIPRSSVKDDGSGNPEVDPDNVARPSLYGHGLFGDYTEANSKNVRQLGDENQVMVCATDWSGMAEDDVIPTAINALKDMSNFEPIPDRLQQGFLNFLYLGRLLRTADGFASSPAFQFEGQPVFDHDQLYYYGNSQGGIAGGALTAIAPDFTRSVLYVPGMRYSELLPRSVDFDTYALILYPSYPVERTRPLLLSMIQSQWDRGEPDGYALHMTSDPLPDTPAHKVLIEMAYGDHQVANITAEAEARTIGARLRRPAIDNDRIQDGMFTPWFKMGSLGNLNGAPADGSGMFVWDIGPKRMVGGTQFGTDPAPLTNTAPTTGDGPDEYGVDPHDTVIRNSPLIRKQIADFLRPDGKITNPCGDHACYAAGWKGMP